MNRKLTRLFVVPSPIFSRLPSGTDTDGSGTDKHTRAIHKEAAIERATRDLRKSYCSGGSHPLLVGEHELVIPQTTGLAFAHCFGVDR